jgi:hypothetical protein
VDSGFAAEKFFGFFFEEIMTASSPKMAASTYQKFLKWSLNLKVGRRESVGCRRKIGNLIEIISRKKLLTIAHVRN